MNHEEQYNELKTNLENATGVVAGWYNGISGKGAMCDTHDTNLTECGIRVVRHPVILEGTVTPICWVSWSYYEGDEDGYDKAMEVCITKANWIAEQINKGLSK